MALVFLSSLMTWTEGDTRCVVDADMDELPADAEMAVDHARLKAPHQPSRPHWEQPIEAPHLDDVSALPHPPAQIDSSERSRTACPRSWP